MSVCYVYLRLSGSRRRKRRNQTTNGQNLGCRTLSYSSHQEALTSLPRTNRLLSMFYSELRERSDPVTDLTRKDALNNIVWNFACDHAFSALKQALSSAPVLRSPDFQRTFILRTDASNRGVGAVLSQRDDDGIEHPVGYFSRKLLPREERYSTVEKECLAIKQATSAFCVYLLGNPFVLQYKDTNACLTPPAL